MDFFSDREEYSALKTAVLLAVVAGLIITIIFLWIGQTSYSAVYIVPSSIYYSSSDNEVYFVYGVKCMEAGGASYSLEFYSGDSLLKTSTLDLKNGETFEEGLNLVLPADTVFPDKILVRLDNGNKTEEVHFWVQ